MVLSAQSQITFESFREQQDKEEKVLLVANTGWYLYNFRLPLAKALQKRGATVVLVSPWDSYVEKLQAEGFWWIELDLVRRSTNPFLELYSIFRLLLIYLVEKPNIVHHFTIKCVLYGTFAAKMSGVKSIVNAITGLGYVFTNTKLKAKLLMLLIRPLYFFALNAKRCQVIVQNKDDGELLVKQKLVSPQKITLIRSSGVDLRRFYPNLFQSHGSTAVVLLASRIVGDKGIYEYIDAVRQLKAQGYLARFRLAGSLYPGNPTAISKEELAAWVAEGIVEWLGHVDNIEDVISESDIVVLPSHGGEGVPKILIEAAAMAKPVVATNVPGCRDVVEPGVNGFLVSAREAVPLANAIKSLLDDPNLRRRMGASGREKVAREFDIKIVLKKTLEVYEKIGLCDAIATRNISSSRYTVGTPII
jgi:glycosyltransferase involved in cell wall biosynthesis